MKFRTFFIITAVIGVLSNLILFFYLQPFIYQLFGYSPRLVSKVTAEAFEAYHRTADARKFFLKFVVFITAFNALLAFIAIRLRVLSKNYLSHIILTAGLILFALFLLVIHLRGLEGLEALG